MYKYKLTFKAHDAKERIRKYEDEIIRIFHFYKEYLDKEPRFQFSETKNTYYMELRWDEGLSIKRVTVDFEPSRQIIKHSRSKYTTAGDFIPVLFSKEELRLFDGLNFTLSEHYKDKKLEQDITDWWDK